MQKMMQVMVMWFLISSCVVLAEDPPIVFDDGLSHTINSNIYQNDYIDVDMNVNNIPGTNINIMDNSLVGGLYAYNNSSIYMSGGQIDNNLAVRDDAFASFSNGHIVWHIDVYDNAEAVMSGGSLYGLRVHHNSNVTITGGIIEDRISVKDNAVVTLSGGLLQNGPSNTSLSVSTNALIYLDGTGFEIDGISLHNGDKLSDFGQLIPNSIYDYYTGRVTGILSDGSALNSDFMIFNTEFLLGIADIVIIPEPATLILIGLGSVIIRKK